MSADEDQYKCPLPEHVSAHPFSDEEIIRLRAFLHVVDDVTEDAQYRLAMRLVFKKWRQFVIGTSLTFATLATFREQIVAGLKAILSITDP